MSLNADGNSVRGFLTSSLTAEPSNLQSSIPSELQGAQRPCDGGPTEECLLFLPLTGAGACTGRRHRISHPIPLSLLLGGWWGPELGAGLPHAMAEGGTHSFHSLAIPCSFAILSGKYLLTGLRFLCPREGRQSV